jgi:uncharacterized protein YcnI
MVLKSGERYKHSVTILYFPFQTDCQMFSYLFLSFLVSTSFAHIGVYPSEIIAGSETTRFTFRFTHGCNATDPTTKFTLFSIPASFGSVKPVYANGWTIVPVKATVTKPDGSSVSQVVNITWSGASVPDSLAGTFDIYAKPPTSATGASYFRALQECASGAVEEWGQVPTGDQKYSDLSLPAPYVNVTTTPATLQAVASKSSTDDAFGLGVAGTVIGTISFLLSLLVFVKVNAMSDVLLKTVPTATA